MFIVRFLVDQDQVWLDMAVPMIAPFAGKWMVNIARRERQVSSKQIDYFHQQGINGITVAPPIFVACSRA